VKEGQKKDHQTMAIMLYTPEFFEKADVLST